MRNVASLWTLTIAVAVFPLSANAESASGNCNAFQLERRQEVSLQDVGRLTEAKIITAGAGSIVYWPFDEEDHPVRAGWHIVGLVFSRRGDLGEVPVGGYLWSKKPSHLVDSSAANSRDSSVSAVFTDDVTTKECHPVLFKLTLKPSGEVYTDGALLGTVK